MRTWIAAEVCPNSGGYAMWVRPGDGWLSPSRMHSHTS